MNTLKLRPFIPSGEDYLLAQRFFEDLGFTPLYSDSSLTIYRTGEQEFFLQNYSNREFQENFMVELIVSDLDDVWVHLQTLTDKYPIRIKEPTWYPWGKREVHLIDPAGVCWHISQANPT